MLIYTGATQPQELAAILTLQRANLPGSISTEEAQEQGFLTVAHELGLLSAMNEPYGHTIAKDGETLAGYVLTMTVDFKEDIPILDPFFELMDSLTWKGQVMNSLPYVLMGQVCVAKAYRGQGVFAGLYRKMQERMAPHFDLIVTEISARNGRSLRAHEKVGFVDMHHYTSPDGEQWVIVGLETKTEGAESLS